MTELVISSLALLLILTNALWAWVTHKLINKLMSRTFWDYQQAKAGPALQKQAAQELPEFKIDQNAAEEKVELDRLDAMIRGVLPLG
jgi:hypothetical protein